MLASVQGFNNRPDLLNKFVKAPLPAENQSFARAWKPAAKERLKEYYKKELENLNE